VLLKSYSLTFNEYFFAEMNHKAQLLHHKAIFPRKRLLKRHRDNMCPGIRRIGMNFCVQIKFVYIETHSLFDFILNEIRILSWEDKIGIMRKIRFLARMNSKNNLCFYMETIFFSLRV
jgi:hypothetical protein